MTTRTSATMAMVRVFTGGSSWCVTGRMPGTLAVHDRAGLARGDDTRP
jgi:hypothetical protein